MELKTTDQAATILGLTRQYLNVYISRHPELKPKNSMPKVNLNLWTDEEIEEVRKARSTLSKGGRPRKNAV